MNFISTRGQSASLSFGKALLEGMPDDGGLFFPEEIPKISKKEYAALVGKSFPEVAAFLFAQFTRDFSAEEIKNICEASYAHFSHPKIAPVSPLKNGRYILELFHGPTGAFKDFALQLFPRLLTHIIGREKKQDQCILVATSGDTGGAALSGFADVPYTSCVCFFPRGGVSPLQQAQMQNMPGKNLKTIEIDGDFDTAQRAMKSLFLDRDFLHSIKTRFGVHLAPANSINIGRLLPQIFYAAFAHLQMVADGRLAIDEPIDVSVPTGNFGDLLSAFIAKKMGVPFGKMICATNANKSAAELIETGVFDVRGRQTKKTISPAMDIFRASNLERLLFFASGGNAKKVRQWQEELAEKDIFRIDAETHANIQNDFVADFSTDAETAAEIKNIFEREGFLVDPHTAVASVVARKKTKNSVLLFSTAHFAKFGESVFRALFPEKPLPKKEADILRALSLIAEKPSIPKHFFHTLSAPIQHDDFLPGNDKDIRSAIEDFLASRRSS